MLSEEGRGFRLTRHGERTMLLHLIKVALHGNPIPDTTDFHTYYDPGDSSLLLLTTSFVTCTVNSPYHGTWNQALAGTKEERLRFPLCKAHRSPYMALKPPSIRLRIAAMA